MAPPTSGEAPPLPLTSVTRKSPIRQHVTEMARIRSSRRPLLRSCLGNMSMEAVTRHSIQTNCGPEGAGERGHCPRLLPAPHLHADPQSQGHRGQSWGESSPGLHHRGSQLGAGGRLGGLTAREGCLGEHVHVCEGSGLGVGGRSGGHRRQPLTEEGP